MTQLLMVIDVALCENCNNCFLACKDEHCGNAWPGYTARQPDHGQRWMNVMRRERGQFPLIDVAYLPKPCQHCADAECIRKGHGAVFRRPDGIVLIDPEKAKGVTALKTACPYGAIWWNEREDLPQKCTFCAHLLDQGWKAPRCVQACPTGALSLHRIEAEDVQGFVAEQGLEALGHNDSSQTFGVYYKNLYRFESWFIAGSVTEYRDERAECAAGAAVVLFRGEDEIARTETDPFGDFKFDRLPARKEEYRLEISRLDEEPKQVSVDLDSSRCIGTVWL